MSADPAPIRPVIQAHANAPQDWDDLLDHCPHPEFTATRAWCDLAARHYRGASSLYLTAHLDGVCVGGLPVVARVRRRTRRLESSLDGTGGGPQVDAGLTPGARAAVAGALCRALAGQVGGRTVLAAVTLAAEDVADAVADPRWLRQEYDAAVVDCRQGLEHVGREGWTNNRRNERNRGLKRGCTLQVENDPAAVAAWYPLYAAESGQWAQAAVPLAFLQALLVEAGANCLFNTVRHEGEIIAGHFCFRSRGRLVAWQGAVRPDLQRTLFPTTLVYWQDISLACAEGLTHVDFGGCVGRDSLWDFKRRCGAQPERRCQLTARSSLGRAMHAVAARWRGRGR